MAIFTNYATLSYNGGTTDSNIVTGELVEVLTASKAAITDNYTAGDNVTYVLSLINSGTSPFTGLSVTDNLGGYSFNNETVYPLSYREGSVRYYVNGVLQAAPTVSAGPPLLINGISVPAGGNAILIYETTVTNYAPLGVEATITNEAVITGDNLMSTLTAEANISMLPRAELSISKAICPSTVTENGQLTYTFVIENSGSVQADAAEQVILTDIFNPKLNSINVTFNGRAWSEGVEYTYDANTGVFATVAGQIIVPAATYTQSSDGTWSVSQGTSTLAITGIV